MSQSNTSRLLIRNEPTNVVAAQRTDSSPAQGRMLENMILFARLLRVGNLSVTPSQISNWIAALDHIDFASKVQFKNATRAILVSNRSELSWFEAAFELFWQARDPRQLDQLELGLIQDPATETRLESVEHSESGSENPSEGEPEPLVSWSSEERLQDIDFAAMTATERSEVAALIRELEWHPQPKQTRRWLVSRKGPEPDLRSALRRNLRNGGELIEIPRRRKRKAPRSLVALCDVSGSMELYSRLLLHFLYALTHRHQHRSAVESFAFGTRLTRLTQDLKRRNVDESLEAATSRIADWGGGTRTGEVLRTFNRDWAHRVAQRGATVLIVSDGWDRGDPALLGRELGRLERSCHRLIWLNPLLGDQEYQPLTRGMQAALPHLDDFLPVHNLRALRQLAEHLEGSRQLH